MMILVKMTKSKNIRFDSSNEECLSLPLKHSDTTKSIDENISFATESSHDIISYPVDLSKLISVGNKVIFVRDRKNKLLSAKMKLTNKSHRYVSFVVRPSDNYKFKIRPKYGYIPPSESVEIRTTTNEPCEFQAISKEYFGIFAIPIYDKRLIKEQQLNTLWRAQGTKLFPFEAAEFHRVAYVLPKSDMYMDELSILGRIENMCFISRRHLPADGSDMAHDNNPIDEDTFFMNWPPPTGDSGDDHTKELLQKDWEQLSLKINNQTRNILDSLKTLMGIGISIATTMTALYYLCSNDSSPFLGIGIRNGYNYAQSGISFWETVKRYVGGYL